MPCTDQVGLQKVLPDPEDKEAIRQTMQVVNKLIDLVMESTGEGRPFFDSAGNGGYVRDSADDSIARQTFKASAMHWPHTHPPGGRTYSIDGVFWEDDYFTSAHGLEGFGRTHIASGHSHAIGLTLLETWDYLKSSLGPEGAS